MKKIFCLLILSCISASAFSTPPLKGKISEIWINDGSNTNIAFVSVGQNFSTPCRPSETQYLIMNLTEPSMKEAYAMALAAYMADKEVTIAGGGVCHGTHEKLKYINLIK